MPRYILIKEGFESKDYRTSVMAASPEEALRTIRAAKHHPLVGNILLEEVAVGEHVTMERDSILQSMNRPHLGPGPY